MKNAELSRAVRGVAALVISVCLPMISWAQPMVDQKPVGAVEWKSVADVFGFPGDGTRAMRFLLEQPRNQIWRFV